MRSSTDVAQIVKPLTERWHKSTVKIIEICRTLPAASPASTMSFCGPFTGQEAAGSTYSKTNTFPSSSRAVMSVTLNHSVR